MTEYLRTFRDVHCSNHPEARIAAVGAKAEWITSEHPLQYGYGAGSPLARLCEAGGKVLLLGTDFTSLTLLHHAEHIADVPAKKVEHFRFPMLVSGKREWVQIEQYDTSEGIVDWKGDYFIQIRDDYVSHGRLKQGKIGAADSYLINAADLTDFAVSWMEERFRDRP